MSKEEKRKKDSICSPDMEMSVVGSMFLNENNAYFAFHNLDNDDFYDPKWKEIFNVCRKEYDSKGFVDKNIVESKIKSIHGDDYVKYTNAIDKAIQFSDNGKIDSYCLELKSLTKRRHWYDQGERIMVKSSDLSVEEDDVRSEIEKTSSAEFETFQEKAVFVGDVEEDEEEEQLITGLEKWDTWFYHKGGRGLGTVELVFGRPGHGKTFYMIRKEAQLALNGQMGIHISLEDRKKEAEVRAKEIIYAQDTQARKKMLLDDSMSYLDNILTAIRYYKHKYDIKWVGIDHLGLVKVKGYGVDQKNSYMIKVSNDLRDICKDLNILGIFAVQPNKSYKQRKGWANVLREEDLKGATEIFEDAFVVTTIFRPNMYPELRGGIGNSEYIKKKGGAEAHIHSVFIGQIKNRRQPVTGSLLHMIQNGSVLYMKDEFEEMSRQGEDRTRYEKRQEDKPPHPADEDEEIPF